MVVGMEVGKMNKLITIYHGSEKNVEQRNKNINKASADTMYRLAKALGCTMEDLIER